MRQPRGLVAITRDARPVDVLHLNGHAVRQLPYPERRAVLSQLLAGATDAHVAASWTARFADVIELTCAHELERVV